MAHFAKIEQDTVTDIIVISNTVLDNKEFPESESIGQRHIKNDLNLSGEWLQTSYNANFRYNYAGIGYLFDRDLDAFIPPPIHKDWSLDKITMTWQPPVPYPNNGKDYKWNQDTKRWEEIT